MKYHNITKDDMLNGDGLRVVLWVSGCSHHCKGCHNPITWDENTGIEFDKDAKEEIFEELNKSYVSGITFSGGDPLFCNNRETVTDFIREIKEKYPQKTIWLYTGYLWDAVKDLEVMSFIDVLVDGKYDQRLYDAKLHWKGSSNQRVIDVPKTKQIKEIVLKA